MRDLLALCAQPARGPPGQEPGQLAKRRRRSLADLLGRRRVYAAGTAVFTLGSLLCGLATGTVFLVTARIVQGIGGTVVFATSLALLDNT